MKNSRIIIIPFAIAALLSLALIQFMTQQGAKKELTAKPYYELYASYFEVKEEYRIFLMVNPSEATDEFVSKYFTPSFIGETSARMKETGHGDHPIKIYLLHHSNILPYGWYKSELNISMNFDLSVLYQHTYLTVTISADAKTLEECTIDIYP
ncbi:MAG: hypothetical protein E7638_05755 [Ruminococcaceae bacterium]|nr:hypothetical protein [Oscillospiraceae bacterium]